jgi:hypothetical protein
VQTLEQLQSGQLLGVNHLKLSCGLTSLPEEIFELAESLEVLDLSGNHLSSLPEKIKELKKLKILFLSDNNFTVFPEVLSQCAQLDMVGFKANQISHISEHALPLTIRWLILTNNRLEYLPQSIERCTALQKVMLAGNQLKQLPEEMSACKKIELLRISANRLDSLPLWVLNLPRLSWLAYSGNDFNPTGNRNEDLQAIAWDQLFIQETLGEGASGVITKSIWRDVSGRSNQVAVKIFKGEVTSDGLPADEMKVCIAAGEHAHLIKVLGKIKQHPANKTGLVLDLIPPSYKNLGGPPNFQTCTRDTFPNTTVFTFQDIIRIASGIADVSVHLHDLGIMHGDLYAHNILINENAYPLLSDFGAASMYSLKDNYAPLFQRLEIRAFGCLLDDLLTHLDSDEHNHPSLNILSQLRSDCMKDETLSRPDFKSIRKQLEQIVV